MTLKQLKNKLKGIVAQMRTALEDSDNETYVSLKAKADDLQEQINNLVTLNAYSVETEPENALVGAGAQTANGSNAPPATPGNQLPTQPVPAVENESDADFRARIMANAQAPNMTNNGEGVNNSFSAGERRSLDDFRLTNFCAQTVEMMRGGGGGLDGLNREVHQMATAEARNNGVNLQGCGVPNAILNYRPQVQHSFSANALQKKLSAHGIDFNPRNDMVAGTTTAGGHLIATELRSPIDVLRERLKVVQLGATMLTGLEGNIDFPRWAVGTDPTEKTENAGADEYTPSLSKFSMEPHRLPIFTEVSNQLLIQSSTDVEAWLRFELGFRQASVMDKRAINGSGVGEIPLGLLNYSGVNVIAGGTNGAAPTRDNLIDMETAIAEDNADEGNMGFLTTPGVRGKMKKTNIDAGSGEFLWDRRSENQLEGYRAEVSTNVPSNLTKGTGTNLHALAFGAWSNLMIGQWGGVDIVVNPFSRDTEGLIRITFTLFYDINFRYAEAFSVMKDLDVS
jgi:HK97 family phage major capsid protein